MSDSGEMEAVDMARGGCQLKFGPGEIKRRGQGVVFLMMTVRGLIFGKRDKPIDLQICYG